MKKLIIGVTSLVLLSGCANTATNSKTESKSLESTAETLPETGGSVPLSEVVEGDKSIWFKVDQIDKDEKISYAYVIENGSLTIYDIDMKLGEIAQAEDLFNEIKEQDNELFTTSFDRNLNYKELMLKDLIKTDSGGIEEAKEIIETLKAYEYTGPIQNKVTLESETDSTGNNVISQTISFDWKYFYTDLAEEQSRLIKIKGLMPTTSSVIYDKTFNGYTCDNMTEFFITISDYTYSLDSE